MSGVTLALGIGAVSSAAYMAFSGNLMRMSVAFFVELTCIGGVLLTLNAEYLALVVLAIGIASTMLILSFAAVVMGDLRECLRRERWRPAQMLGMLTGLGLAAAVGAGLWNAPLSGGSMDSVSMEQLLSAGAVGKRLLGDQVAVFELLGIILFGVVLGVSLLLRRNRNAG